MSEHEFELQKAVPDTSEPDGERLQESLFTDTMAAVGGLAGFGSLYYTRAQYLLAREDHDAEREAIRREFEAQYEADRRALDIEYRALVAQTHGLDALDRLDGFGVDSDDFGGFRVE